MGKAVKPACQSSYGEMERLYGVFHSMNGLSAILCDNYIIRLIRIFAPYRRV